MTSAEFARNRDNFCYRHPDRQSFVLCQRCLRTICPECQTQGAVGVICPECLQAQRKSASSAEKRAQRRWGRGTTARATATTSGSGQPIVAYVLIAITVATFLLQLLSPVVDQWLTFYAPTLYPSLTGTFQPWRLLSVLFLHSGWVHLALNMLALWMLGRVLEPLLGHGRFLVLYLVSGLGGSVAVALIAFGTPVVGASGAIYGLFGALLVIGRHLGGNITGIAVILAINFAIGFVPGFQVAWQAHLGGLVVGALIGLIYARTRRYDQRLVQGLLTGGVVVALLGLLLVPPLLIG